MDASEPLLLVQAFQCRLCETLGNYALARCAACGAFNSVREVMVEPRALAARRASADRFQREIASRRRHAMRTSDHGGPSNEDDDEDDDDRDSVESEGGRRSRRDGDDDDGDDDEDDEPAEAIGAIDSTEANRIQCHIDEIDEFFNGGIPEGNAIMVGGDAGIGKSSFALQILTSISRRGHKTLYVTGEEEKTDIAQRLRRFKGYSANVAQRLFVKKTDAFERMQDSCIDLEPLVCVVDSLPVLRSIAEGYENLREGSPKLVQMLAKTLRAFAAETGIVFLVIVHESKDGKIAGPNRVKHWLHGATRFVQPFKRESEEAIADPSLMRIRCLAFEGKYRGGPTDKQLYFTMDNEGLHPVDENDLPLAISKVPDGYGFGDRVSGKTNAAPKPDKVARRKSPADHAIAVPKKRK